jgi:hypothetical protein
MLRTRRNSPLHWLSMLLLPAAMTLAMASSSWAFDVAGVGGRIGVTDPDALDPTPSLGVHAEMEQRGSQLHLMPNLSYWNSDRVSNVNPNLDMYYHFERDNHPSPYLGGGLGLNFRHNDRVDRSQTDVGVNVIGGMSFPDRSTARRYYLEGRYTASEMNQISLMTGITFGTR